VLGSLLYFLDGKGRIHMASASSASLGGEVKFEAKLTVRRDEEFAEVFEQSWRLLNENFYDPTFHGANWRAVREKYRPLVKHVALKEDLHALISLMLGELNASHLGLLRPPSAPEETTADLGLVFDEKYPGPGLKVAEILKRGPADRRGINLKAGDVIESIDRVTLTDKIDLARLLNDKAGQAGKPGETVLLSVTANPADPKAPRRRVEIEPVSRPRVRTLLYQRWVENNTRKVAELSKGKLGYIHIPSMDDAGLDQFLRALYSDNFDKEAIVLDVRYNSGGFTHDRVLNYLGGREHTFFLQRHGGVGAVLTSPDRRWAKPLALLINNRSYSDAEIFPHAFRTLGLGKLIGQPTGAHVIGTERRRLIDGSQFMLPRIGVFTSKGINMEKVGVAPDFTVEPLPDELARGIDRQLEKAVEVLEQDVIQWRKRPGVAEGPPRWGLPPPDGGPTVEALPRPAPMVAPGSKGGE
jgi:tricorn protease